MRDACHPRRVRQWRSFDNFRVDQNGELWFVDCWTQKPILVRHMDWSGFSEGGTLRDIVKHMAAYIQKNGPLNIRYFSPSPQWVCDGDLWGYGEDMPKVRDAVAAVLAEQGSPAKALISTKSMDVKAITDAA